MSGTAHDDAAAHEQKSAESKSSESSESRILKLYTERLRSFAVKNGKQSPPYSDGILTPPWHKDSGRYMLRKPRDESYIDAAFRSSRTNEVFMFTGFHYFVVKYDAQSYSQREANENHVITKSPLLLIDGFYKLYGCPGFCDGGVDAAFGCYGTNKAFLFSRRWGAKIEYDSNNEGQVLELKAMRWWFMSPEDTKFSQGFLDAACESTVPNEAYLFKGSDYALVNYSNQSQLTLIKEGRITDEFTCLRNTPFESDIGSAFASHKFKQFYFFKDNTYVLIEFDSKAKESRIIAGPEEIVPTNWPCLVSYLPYHKYKTNPYPIQPKTWKPIYVGGFLECVPLANDSLERNSSERKRKLEDYAPDASGSSSKSMPGPNEASLEYTDDPFDDYEALNWRLCEF
ncbi:albumin-2-like [Chenopodium quinoa]|uniref:albumin-2-like n=1 Tax=Chenopodium quinoa TaxID=63459 RepID=UPI000B79655F|nr:albumin-2-like [Chenopodium quinoa]XP_021762143.1 albumin-2-like [Chenopodium quinoa]XP_021762144.1 albumin-2-like [Chenopodium quinoa]